MATALLEEIGILNIIDDSGDSRMQWDRNNPEQVVAARTRFDELRAQHYLAYRVDASGKQGEVIDKFDPKAERIILHQRMVGG